MRMPVNEEYLDVHIPCHEMLFLHYEIALKREDKGILTIRCWKQDRRI